MTTKTEIDETELNIERHLEDMQHRLDRLELEFEKLDVKAKTLKLDLRERFARAKRAVEDKRTVLKERIANAREAGAAAWDQMRGGVESAWTEMQEAFQAARAELNKR